MTDVGFCELQRRLVEHLRLQVRNGLWTERALARLTGVSQPHMHNVLKGARELSTSLCDVIMMHLNLSIHDLLTSKEADDLAWPSSTFAYVPVLDGLVGPGYPWPHRCSTATRQRVSRDIVAGMLQPIAARLADDPEMSPLFLAGDIAIVDQRIPSRRVITPDSLYLLHEAGCGVIRRLKRVERVLYVVSEVSQNRPADWRRITLNDLPILQIVRARVLLTPSENAWEAQPATQDRDWFGQDYL